MTYLLLYGVVSVAVFVEFPHDLEFLPLLGASGDSWAVAHLLLDFFPFFWILLDKGQEYGCTLCCH